MAKEKAANETIYVDLTNRQADEANRVTVSEILENGPKDDKLSEIRAMATLLKSIGDKDNSPAQSWLNFERETGLRRIGWLVEVLQKISEGVSPNEAFSLDTSSLSLYELKSAESFVNQCESQGMSHSAACDLYDRINKNYVRLDAIDMFSSLRLQYKVDGQLAANFVNKYQPEIKPMIPVEAFVAEIQSQLDLSIKQSMEISRLYYQDFFHKKDPSKPLSEKTKKRLQRNKKQ
ncbi:MAG TPA: hypothetical protein PL131_09575 [Methylotenera sp.]|nr:hypothetical protein [Methylotenera sp.]HPH06112.1 hypothetical protein [Methylotenera sp.]